MNLTPREKDKLLVAMAAEVARRRLARGVKLNHPEAIALISDFVVEGARDGRSVSELMSAGASVVSPDSKRKHQELNAFCENLNRISPVLQLQDDSITQIQSNQEQEDHKSLFKLYKQRSEKGRNS